MSLERMNYYSDSRVIAGMTKTHAYINKDQTVNWDFVFERFTALSEDDDLENDEVSVFLEETDWSLMNIGCLLWLKAKFPELREIPSKASMMEADEIFFPSVTISAKYEVCPTCEGRGKHVNPSIDCGGITESEWAEWGHEERDMYTSGGYDVICNQCNGLRVVLAPSKAPSGSFHEWLQNQCEEANRLEHEYAQERANELRWGY